MSAGNRRCTGQSDFYMNVPDVAKRWSCSMASVLMLIRQRKLAAHTLTGPPGRGRPYFIPFSGLRRFERRRTCIGTVA